MDESQRHCVDYAQLLKSSCLAIDVAQGNDFLGRQTMQAGAIYFALEEPIAQVQRRMKATGFRPSDPLYTHTEPLRGSRAEIEARLEATLDVYPDVRLLVIDTLFKMSRINDANAYVDTQNGVEWLHNLAMDRGIAIIALHHSKKATAVENRSSGNISGSNAIAAGASNIIELSRQHADKATSPRILRMNEFRYGQELEPTILSFDVETQRYSVCGSLLDFKSKSAEEARHQTEKEILEYVAEHPGCGQADIIQFIPGSTKDTKAVLYHLLKGESPALRREGDGVKGDPHQYFLADLPQEAVASGKENQAKEMVN
jgi:hypothetical protein